METGKALEIVHAMAKEYWIRDGRRIHVMGRKEMLTSSKDQRDALDTVEDFIVNNFEET